MSKDLETQLLERRRRSRATRQKKKADSPPITPTVTVLSIFVIVAFLVISIFASSIINPYGQYRVNASEIAELNGEIEVLQKRKYELDTAIKRLETDEEVIRVARRDFNLVFPGESAYAFRTPKEKPVVIPTSWPFSILYDEVID